MDNTGAGRLWKTLFFKEPNCRIISCGNFYFSKEVFRMMKTKSHKITARMLTESAIMIALATVLSFIKLWDFPAGGSITIASMFPVAVIAYRHGTPWGLFTACVYGIVQQLVDLGTLAYAVNWQAAVAIILLDYIVAFAVIGLAGVFKKKISRQSTALVMGSLLVCVLRYICHFISGATVWAGLSIPTEAAALYSLAYNATYMIPETMIVLLVALYMGENIDFTKQRLVRIKRENMAKGTAALLPTAGLCVLAALIYDIVAIFGRLQNEDGVFDLAGLANVNWIVFAIINAVAAVITVVLIVLYKTKQKNFTK